IPPFARPLSTMAGPPSVTPGPANPRRIRCEPIGVRLEVVRICGRRSPYEEASLVAAHGQWAMVRASAAALLAAGTAGLSGLAAAGPASAQLTPVKHIVVLYLENHSFDNVLGYWCRKNPGRCPDGGMPSLVTLSNGARVTPSVTPDKVPAVGHDVAAQ